MRSLSKPVHFQRSHNIKSGILQLTLVEWELSLLKDIFPVRGDTQHNH